MVKDNARGAADAAPRLRLPRQAVWLTALAICAVGAIGWTLWHLPSVQERRLSHLSLVQLQKEQGRRLDDPRLLYYIGLRLNQQGRYTEADPYLRNAVALDPDSPRLRDAWMQALLGSGLTTAAFGETREFAGTHPSSAPAHLILGKFYVSQNSLIRASEELSRAVALDPSLGEAWSALAVAQNGLSHLPEAEAAAEKAVALRPASAPDNLGLALVRARLGRPAEARASFGEALACGPNIAAVHEEYARFLLATGTGAGDSREAEAQARRALSLDPASADAPGLLGQALAAQGRGADALPLLRQAADRRPYDPAPALVLAQTYARLGQAAPQALWQQTYIARQARAKAESDLVTAILKDPAAPGPQRRLARMLAEEGDVAGCLRHQAKALRCAPDAPPAQVAGAEDLLAVGRAAQALPLAQRAVKVARNSPTAYEALGDVQLALNQPEDAVVSYGKSAREDKARIQMFQARLDRYARQHAALP